MSRSVSCPTCSKGVVWSAESLWRPFCSERCRLIDLGEWASESHRIAGSPANPWESVEEGQLFHDPAQGTHDL